MSKMAELIGFLKSKLKGASEDENETAIEK
jgi:hypothetical protein